MTTHQMQHQYPLDLDLPTVEQPIQVAPTHVLAVIEMPSAVEQQLQQYGVFLPKRIRDEIKRNNGRTSQRRSL